MYRRPVESRPDCSWASRLVEHARGELRGREREELERHVASCPSCAAELEDVTACLDALESAVPSEDSPSRLEPGPGLKERVLARLPSRRRRFFSMRSAAAIAAACFVVAGVVTLRGTRESRSGPITSGESLSRAVAWLTATQEPEGGWDPAKWNGSAQYRVGVSGLAVMALAGSGSAGVEEPIERGTRFLLASQSSSGLFGPDFRGSIYNHGIATLALVRSRGSSGDSRLRSAIDKATDKAVGYLIEKQLPSGGWGYADEAADAGSSAVTIWPLQALAAARSLGREDVSTAIDRGLAWLERASNGGGSLSPSPSEVGEHVCGAASGPAFKALAVLLKSGGGHGAELRSRESRRAMDGVVKALAAGRLASDPYESYFVLRVLESHDLPPFRSLRAEAQRTIARSQVTSGPLAGTWEPVGRWSPAGGRLCTTALAALTLESRGGEF